MHTYIRMYAIAYIHTCILTCLLCNLYLDEKAVHVNTPTRRLTLRARPSDTVWDIKRKFEYATGISVYNQQLKLVGQPLPLLDLYILPSSAHLTLQLETKLSDYYCYNLKVNCRGKFTPTFYLIDSFS